MLSVFNKTKNQQQFDQLGNEFHDCHAWCVMDGKIIDTSPLEGLHSFAIETMNLEDTLSYEPYDGFRQKVFNEELVERVKAEEAVVGKRHDFYNEPRIGYCYYNAFAFKEQNPKAKIVFGGCGYKHKQNKKKGKKNRKGNNKPTYWVIYGDMTGGQTNDETCVVMDKLVKKAAIERNLPLLAKLKYFYDRHEEKKDATPGEFVYTIDKKTLQCSMRFERR